MRTDPMNLLSFPEHDVLKKCDISSIKESIKKCDYLY